MFSTRGRRKDSQEEDVILKTTIAASGSASPVAQANAFIGARKIPTEEQLATALGPAKAVWDQLLRELASVGATVREWKSYSAKSGWALRLKHGQRTIVWLAPCRRSIQVVFILGDRAVEAARAADLPMLVTTALDAATRYPEGTGVRFAIRSAREIAPLLRLAEIKRAH
jgi:hypothetical protein